MFFKKNNKLRGGRVVLLLILVITLISGSLVLGFYSNKLKINPLYDFMFRVERKLGKILGEPSLTEKLVKSINTTFVELRGHVFEIPHNDYINGGALAEWGKYLLIMTHSGDIFYLDESKGLLKTKISPPDSGIQGYMRVSKKVEYRNFSHKISKFRFNGIQFIKNNVLHGIAVSYTFFDEDKECYGTRVSWLPISLKVKTVLELSASKSDWEVVFDTSPCLALNPNWTALDGQMAGGRIVFLEPSTLVLGSGEYHLDGIHTYDVGIQSDETSYGKVIAIDLLNKESHIISKGHRNLQGLAIDNVGRLWATEHGVRGGDELNLIKEGFNYGWPVESLGTLYSGQRLPGQEHYGRHVINTPPVYAWLPSAGISSLTSISGVDESWDGDLLAGSLSSAEFGQSLFHIRIREERVVFVERIKLNKRVRFVSQYGKNKIAVWLDSNELVIFSISKYKNPLLEVNKLMSHKHGEVVSKRVMQVLNSCNECHSFNQNDHQKSPSLNGVFGRKIASTAYNGYSAGLLGLSGRWDAGRLRLFLKDPKAFSPGSTMPAIDINDDALLELVVDALRNINTAEKTHLTYN